MKKYIFFTNTIGGYSGGTCYIRNKVKWLQEHSWDVTVFDSTGQFYESILFDNLQVFSANRILELYYHPSWLSNKRFNRIINRITEIINPNPSEYIIIESNLCILSEWAEIVAARIGAKHIFYLISENGLINTYDDYVYHKYKAFRNELFTINSQRYISLFQNYQTISIQEANLHVLKANNASDILPIVSCEIDKIRKTDYTIGHFGRYKDYIPYVIDQICIFANNNCDKTCSLVFLGVESLDKVYLKKLNKVNVNVKCIPSTNPIPQSFFDTCEIIIATAGCASMAYRNGSYVVSMDVEKHYPLGIMGITTISSSFKSSVDVDQPNLNAILDNFYNNRYNLNSIKPPSVYKIDYCHHLIYATESDGEYFDTYTLGKCRNLRDLINKLVIKIGLIRTRTLIRYFAFTKKIVIKPLLFYNTNKKHQ